MLLFVVSLILALAGVALLVAGRRGRRVGDEPRCVACGFDLRGRPVDSHACPECGRDLNRPGAVVHGTRTPRRIPLLTGLALSLAALVGLGVIGHRAYSEFDWYDHKPTSWLLRDLDTAPATNNDPDAAELLARLWDDELNDDQAEALVDAILVVQGDRGNAWPTVWSDLLEAAVDQSRLTKAQRRRYVRQAFDVGFKVRPILRRGAVTRLELNIRNDRVSPDHLFMGGWHADPITIGGEEFTRGPIFDSKGSQTHIARSFGSSVVTDVDWLPTVPDGPTRLKTTLHFKMTPHRDWGNKPDGGPVAFDVPIDIPVTLAAADAVVDEFVAPPHSRDAMAGAVEAARVETKPERSGRGSVWVKFGPSLPANLAMRAVVRQDGREFPGRTLLRLTSEGPGWERIDGPKDTPAGRVDVILRPDQEAADSQMDLRTYWGEEIVISGVVVDAPYAPPFNADASLAPAVEAAVRLTNIGPVEPGRRYDPSRRLRVKVEFENAPCPLAYRVVIRANGAETSDPDTQVRTKAGQNMSYGERPPLPDGVFDVVDIWLIPDAGWEAHADATDPPPWGFPLLFENVRLPDSGETLTKPIQGRAVLDGTGVPRL